jgi:hypothetical protein
MIHLFLSNSAFEDRPRLRSLGPRILTTVQRPLVWLTDGLAPRRSGALAWHTPFSLDHEIERLLAIAALFRRCATSIGGRGS